MTFRIELVAVAASISELGTGSRHVDDGAQRRISILLFGPGTVAARASVAYHFDPYARVTPWLAVGAGYRYVYERREAGQPAAPGLHGLECLSATLGTDICLQPELALAPVIGADFVMFLWDASGALSEPRSGAFLYLGMLARVDMGANHAVSRFVARK
jgi:hypothetical protein